MMRLIGSLLAMLRVLGTAVRPGALEGDVRAALAAEDYPRLETLLTEAHAAARAGQDFTAFPDH